MLRLGLTGGLASGKSVIAAELERLGCVVVRADQLGHEVLSRGGEAYAATVERFGQGILKPTGEIDRSKLAALVFPDAEALAALNSLVHPAVFAREAAIFDAAPADAIVVVEAAILIESGSYRSFDKLILAHCPESVQIERAMLRPGATLADVQARLARQLSLEKKLAFADYVIDTSGTEENTLRETRRLFDTLREDPLRTCASEPLS